MASSVADKVQLARDWLANNPVENPVFYKGLDDHHCPIYSLANLSAKYMLVAAGVSTQDGDFQTFLTCVLGGRVEVMPQDP